jgi:hypothetical protein
MVEFGGAAHPKFAGSGTLTVIDIHLSQDTPLEIIQQILALVSAPQEGKGRILNATVAIGAGITVNPAPEVYRPNPRAGSSSLASVLPTLKLIPVDGAARKDSSWLRLILDAVSIPYYVVWTGVGILTFIGLIQPHIQEIKEAATGLTVPFTQLMERVTNTQHEEHAQPTPKSEHHEKSGSPPAISSDGD